MRLVAQTGPGKVELLYTWLPLFLGMNESLKQRIEAEISPHLVGRLLTDELLDEANDRVLDFIAKEFPAIEGLRDYLEGVKYIDVREDG